MIEIGIDPNLFTVGRFTVSWHGLLTALAVIIAVIVAARLSKRAGIPTEQVYATAVWAVLGGIIGTRVFHIVDNFSYYADNPGEVLAIWSGGMSLYGALLGGLLGGFLYVKYRGLRAGLLANVAAPGMILAQAFGRLGCLINGDAYGTATSLPWGVAYTNPNAAETTKAYPYVGHPVPAYEILWDLFVLAILWRLMGSWIRRDWMFFLLYLSLYSLGRFFLSFIRGDEQTIALGLHQAHFIALAVMVVAVPLLVYLSRRRIEVTAAEAVEAPVEETPPGEETP